MGNEFCKDHKDTMSMLHKIDNTVTKLDERVATSLDRINSHVESGRAWRAAIVGVALTMILTVSIQVGTFLFLWGKLTQLVDSQEARISNLETLFPRMTGIEKTEQRRPQ